MRIVVVGATGNVGTSLIRAVADDPQIESVLGLARRVPEHEMPKTTWAKADITTDDLVPHFRGADAVIHLAWVIQPSRDLNLLYRVNVDGSQRVFRAVADAGVPSLVYASSVGAYSPAPKDYRVDESWPTNGIATSFYSRHKAATERMLDSFEKDNPSVRVVRLRPALIFKREAATGVRRLFAGPFLPNRLVTPRLIPLMLDVDRLVFQTVHSYDVGEAYRLAIVTDVKGAFNITAEPVLGPKELADLFGAALVKIPEGVVRVATDWTWRLRLQPTPVGWIDMAYNAPLLDATRAQTELGWTAKYSSKEALLDVMDGMRDGADFPTPPLAAETTSPLRIKELLTGVGKRTGLS